MTACATSDSITTRLTLTPEEAAHVATKLAGAEIESAALVLLLCSTLAFEPDDIARDDVYTLIEERVAPYLINVSKVVRGPLECQLKALREQAGKATEGQQ